MVSRVELNGSLPHKKGTTHLDYDKIALKYGWDRQLIKKARHNWLQIFRRENSTLTFKDYLDKLVEAKISPKNVGIYVSQYHLSRDLDIGGYHKNNCKFLLVTENLKDAFRNGRSQPFRSPDAYDNIESTF